MEKPPNSWNDDRLDELNRRVDEGFTRVDREMKQGFARVVREMKEGFARVDREMKEGFTRVDRQMKEGFAKVDRRFEGVATREELGELKVDLRRLNDKFDRLLHALTVAGLSFGITLFATIAGFVVTQA